MINYVGIYLIAGENIFKSEIAQLQNIDILIPELIIVGLAYYLLFVIINVISNLNETKATSDKLLAENPSKTILIILMIIIAITLIFILLNLKVFSENMSIMNIVTFMIIMVACGLCICIKSSIESDLIKKINRKLKENNK